MTRPDKNTVGAGDESEPDAEPGDGFPEDSEDDGEKTGGRHTDGKHTDEDKPGGRGEVGRRDETHLQVRSQAQEIGAIIDSAVQQGSGSGIVSIGDRDIEYTIDDGGDGRSVILFDGHDLGMLGGSDVAIPLDADEEEAAIILRRRREQERKAHAEESGYDPRREATQRAYEADWRLFCEWCEDNGRKIPADAQTVAAYVRDMIGTYKKSTMRRKLTAINQFHQKKGHDRPARTTDDPLHTAWQRFARESRSTVEQAEAAVPEIVRLFIDEIDETYESARKRLSHEKRRKAKRIAWRRNRAGVLLSLYGALRVSELLGLRKGDVLFQSGAMILQLQEAKTAKAGELQRVIILENEGDGACPHEEMKAWISLLTSSIDGELHEDDPIFRGIDQWGNVRENAMRRQNWWKIVKETARGAGNDLRRLGYEPEDFSTHSFRAGFVTYSGQIGYDEDRAMRHTRHKSLKVFRQYRREGEQMSRDTNMTSKISV